jgi:[ribosomal protein S5]-alanine N-acetyltransferase
MVVLHLPTLIETPRLFIQRLKYEDAEEIFYTYASKPEATRYVAWPTHQSLADTRAFLTYAHAAWESNIDFSYSIRLADSGRLIGGIGAINDDGKVQFGYILSPTQWNQGYATEACQALLSHLKAIPSIYRIWTLVDAENTASIRVLQKAGLVQEALLINWFRFINQNNDPKDCLIFRL